MSKEVKIEKTNYNKEQFNKIVDKTFKFFKKDERSEDIVTVAEFFKMYEELYLEIPVVGDINSHEYILKRSSELVDIEKDTEAIEPLLEEISQLREELLVANQEIFKLQTESIKNV